MSTDKISSDWTWVDRTSFEGKRRWGKKKQAIVEEKTYQRHCRNMRRSFQNAGAISKVGAQKILIASCLPKQKILIFVEEQLERKFQNQVREMEVFSGLVWSGLVWSGLMMRS